MKGGGFWNSTPEGKVKESSLTEAEIVDIKSQQSQEIKNSHMTMKDATVMNYRNQKDIIDEINALKKQYSETENNFLSDQPLKEFEEKQIDELSKLSGTPIKDMVAVISNYNARERL